ncbi:MAG TPA: iron ABC transporter permease [Bacteroidota bacterium]|nr:iron ABC transporter permease [Bacteroidota bacterium]
MTSARVTPGRVGIVLGTLTLILVAVVLGGLSVGVSLFSPLEVMRALFGSADDAMTVIIRDLRLPRVLLALIIGGGLSVAGATFQALLRNTLAEPYVLGISSGGAAGAVVAVILQAGSLALPVFSLVGSGLVMILVYSLGHRRGFLDPNSLLLSGVMVGAFFNAFILLIVAVFSQETRTAYLWLLGNLAGADFASVGIVSVFILLASSILVLHAKSFNLIAMGEESAMFLGADVETLKRLSYIAASVVTGLAVSVSGVIGFVGLIVPHSCRLLFGPDHRLLLPASFLVGGSFLILCDIISRVALAPTEIPIGAITAVLGAPFFIVLLKKSS